MLLLLLWISGVLRRKMLASKNFGPSALLGAALLLIYFQGGVLLVKAGYTHEPELPRVFLDTTLVVSGGKNISVKPGADLQAALNTAKPGDTIILQSGATYTGNFTLPAKTGKEWIIIRSSANDSGLPPPGNRTNPGYSNHMPKLISPNADPAVMTAPGAHNYRLIGLEIGIKSGVPLNYAIVKLGDWSKAQDNLNVVPQDIIIDRCYIHGNPTGDVTRGIALNSGRTAVIDSYISECHGVGFDTQAICGWNGPGPFKIVNNYLEGAGENFMLGGADASIPNLNPSDIEFKRNYLRKPLNWKAGDASYANIHWSVKNLFELKNARRVIIDSNIFENNWVDAQNGFAILFTPRNDGGTAPWATVQDVTFVNNIVRHSAAGINIFGLDNNNPNQPGRRLKISNNLFDDIGGPKWGGNGVFLQISETPDVIVNHNTVMQRGNIITAYGMPSPNFVFTNNLILNNQYGVIGDEVGVGKPALNRYFPDALFRGNIIIGGQSRNYPIGNFFPGSVAEVGFTDTANGIYRLAKNSQFKGAALDKTDIGCDYDVLTAVIEANTK